MNIKNSIISRYQNYIFSNFENSKYGKNMKRFKNIHQGKRCFVLGNGPSLSPDDLTLMQENGEITFGVNRVFNIFDKTDWRPYYYVSEDELIIGDIQDTVISLQAKGKFIPINLKWYHNISIDGANYFKLNYREENAYRHFFSTDASRQVDCTGTVTITCIQLAFYMGFSEIYLVGVDHNFSKVIDEHKNVIIDETVKDYFCEDYDTDVKDQVTHDLGRTTNSYRNVRLFCDENGIIIKNATRGGKLEVFERADLDALLGEKHGK